MKISKEEFKTVVSSWLKDAFKQGACIHTYNYAIIDKNGVVMAYEIKPKRYSNEWSYPEAYIDNENYYPYFLGNILEDPEIISIDNWKSCCMEITDLISEIINEN